MIAALVRSEYRKIVSTRGWWGLLIPVVLLSLLINAFGGLIGDFAEGVSGDEVTLPLLLASLAYTLALTASFAAVSGAVGAAGEFRHRTITTTYLTAPGRGAVLAAKMLTAAAVGVVYALAATVLALVGGLLGQGGGRFPEVGPLLAVIAIGVAVCALWSAIGVALGTAMGNQVGALVTLLIYVLLGELLISLLLGASDAEPVAQITAYLPVNAGEVALYDIPATEIAGSVVGRDVAGLVAGVTGPLPWGVSLLVLAAWTAAAAAVAWWAAGRRDIT
jgi:ABC-type transport system involved in multi-copper enzyme maturation permease subunit